MDTQLKKGAMDLCVLSILEKKDYYGYELVQKISKVLTISEGTLYPILKRLKNEQWLETYLKESKEGPARKYYGITRTGKIHLKKLKEDWKEFIKKVNEIIK
ncbi:MAG: PadR family transcriptional regulator [Nanoarchaeota archaeon]|nr:PadR family transcriptional regulator [Nanoarchaeota archaeon]